MGIFDKLKDLVNPKSAFECRREILRELKRQGYKVEPAKRGERACWWNLLVVDGQRYIIVGCQEDEFKAIVADIRSRYNAKRIGLLAELASPNFRGARI